MSTERIAQLEAEMADLEAELIHLNPQSRSAAAVREKLTVLRAELDALLHPPHISQRIEAANGGTASGNRQIHVASGGAYHEAPRDPTLAREERALRDYLRAAHGDCRVLQLGALDEGDARNSASMGLDNVYVGLHTERQIEVAPTPENDPVTPRRRSLLDRALGWVNAALGREAIDDPEQAQLERALRSYGEETRPLTALEAIDAQPRLVLLGVPGGGKSTFVNHLLLCLSGAALAERGERFGDAEIAWLERLPGWKRGTLLPIRIILRDFAAAIDPAAARTPLQRLHEFVKTMSADHPDANGPLLAALGDGRAILLFDGLDEVVGSRLPLVLAAITAAQQTYARTPMW